MVHEDELFKLSHEICLINCVNPILLDIIDSNQHLGWTCTYAKEDAMLQDMLGSNLTNSACVCYVLLSKLDSSVVQ